MHTHAHTNHSTHYSACMFHMLPTRYHHTDEAQDVPLIDTKTVYTVASTMP